MANKSPKRHNVEASRMRSAAHPSMGLEMGFRHQGANLPQRCSYRWWKAHLRRLEFKFGRADAHKFGVFRQKAKKHAGHSEIIEQSQEQRDKPLPGPNLTNASCFGRQWKETEQNPKVGREEKALKWKSKHPTRNTTKALSVRVADLTSRSSEAELCKCLENAEWTSTIWEIVFKTMPVMRNGKTALIQILTTCYHGQGYEKRANIKQGKGKRRMC